LKQAHPDEPWLWRADWAAGEIHSSAKPRAVALGAIAILWNLIAVPIAVAPLFAHDLRQEPQFALLAIFPLIGFGLIGFALHPLLRWRTYGISRFRMKSVPGQIGGTLEGAIYVERGIRPMRRVTLKLVCMALGYGEGSSDRLLWGDEFEAETGGDGAVPVTFLLPPECRPTDQSILNNRIFWHLCAESPGGLANYKARFEVPIFAMAETPAQTEELRIRRDQRVSGLPPQGTTISVGLIDDGRTRIHFRAFRNPAMIFTPLGFLGGWGWCIYLAFEEQAPLSLKIPLLGIEAFIALLIIQMIFESTTVLAGNGELTVTRQLLDIQVSTHRVASNEVRDVRPIMWMAVSGTVYERLQVRYGRDQKLNFGGGIRDPIEADWIAAKISAALHLPWPAVAHNTVA
jgi:hypothetical protein